MAARFGRVVIDVGAGDGGYAVHRARGEPNTFAIAIDASPDALSDGAWRAHRLRLSNVAFLVTAVEQLPARSTRPPTRSPSTFLGDRFFAGCSRRTRASSGVSRAPCAPRASSACWCRPSSATATPRSRLRGFSSLRHVTRRSAWISSSPVGRRRRISLGHARAGRSGSGRDRRCSRSFGVTRGSTHRAAPHRSDPAWLEI